MAAPTELSSFVTKFANLWHSGKNACLSLECEAGEAIFNLQLRLQSHHRQPQQVHPHYSAERKAGPSRLRRRARRAQARPTAAAEAPTLPSQKPEAAAQANVFTPANSDAAVQAASQPDRAVVALSVPPVPAAQAGHHSHEGHADHPSDLVSAAQAGTVSSVSDVLHTAPDDPPHPRTNFMEYLSRQTIPQLDGSMHSTLRDQWSCLCCQYAKHFSTEDQLNQHHKAHMVGYEDCNICFTGHVWIRRDKTTI